MAEFAVTLDDKYTLDEGRVFITGVQALARLPMVQRQRDVISGLNTAGFISGSVSYTHLTLPTKA